MAQQIINIGTTANDRTGDPLRDAYDKINDNFTELYNELGGTSLSNISISGNTITSDNSNGDINIDPNGTGNTVITSGHLLPAADSTLQNIGSSTDKWTNMYSSQGHFDSITINGPTQTTVGSAGGASALPGTPTGYLTITISGTEYIVPYYAKS